MRYDRDTIRGSGIEQRWCKEGVIAGIIVSAAAGTGTAVCELAWAVEADEVHSFWWSLALTTAAAEGRKFQTFKAVLSLFILFLGGGE